MATRTRTITATAPDGTRIAKNVNATRQVGAIRITTLDHVSWITTVHKTLANAVSGPNRTPMWNSARRWALQVDETGAMVGEWVRADK